MNQTAPVPPSHQGSTVERLLDGGDHNETTTEAIASTSKSNRSSASQKKISKSMLSCASHVIQSVRI